MIYHNHLITDSFSSIILLNHEGLSNGILMFILKILVILSITSSTVVKMADTYGLSAKTYEGLKKSEIGPKFHQLMDKVSDKSKSVMVYEITTHKGLSWDQQNQLVGYIDSGIIQ